MLDFQSYKKAASVAQSAVLKGMTCSEGMSSVLEWASKQPGRRWKALHRIAWDQDVALCSVWLMQLLQRSKPRRPLRGLWFGVPEIEMNTAILQCAGSDKFDRRGRSVEWAVNPHWPSRPSRDFEFRMHALEEARTVLGVARGYSEAIAEKESLAFYCVPLAYCGLLVSQVVRAMPPDVLGKGGSVGVIAGFASGDFIRVGQFNPREGRVAKARK